MQKVPVYLKFSRGYNQNTVVLSSASSMKPTKDDKSVLVIKLDLELDDSLLDPIVDSGLTIQVGEPNIPVKKTVKKVSAGKDRRTVIAELRSIDKEMNKFTT